MDYATADGSAVSGSGNDYTEASGTLTFSAGDESKTLTVAILDDSVDEADEDFTLALSNSVNATVTTGTATVTITDSTVPGAPGDFTATASGRTRIVLAWTAPTHTGGAVITGYRIEWSAEGGAPWTELVASHPETGHTDRGLEPGTTRHYRVSAVNAEGAAGPPSEPDSATTSSLEALTARFVGLPESHSAARFEFDIVFDEVIDIAEADFRDHALEVTGGSVKRAWALDGLADIWRVRLKPDDAHTAVTIALAADRDCAVTGAICTDDGRRLTTALEATVAGKRVAGKRVVTLALHPPAIDEAGGTSTVTSTVTPASAQGFTVEVSAAVSPAVSPAVADGFTLSENTTLSFAANATESTGVVTITAVDNDVDAPDRAVTVSGSVAEGTEVAAPGDVTLSLLDDDTRGVTVEPTALTVAEAGSGSYTVVLDTEPTAEVTVSVAGAAGDVSASPTELTYTTSNWSTEQTVTVTAGEDDDTADDTVKLTHTAVSTDGDYDGATVDEMTVTITDNDAAGVTGPVRVTAVSGGPSSIELSWTAPSGAGGGAVTGYRIQVSADEGVTWTELMHDTGTTTSHVHRGLPRGAQRYYRVAALRTNEVGPYGAPDYARTTPAAPGKPKLTARLDAERYLRLVWNDVTDGTDGTGRIAVNYDAAWSDTSARGPWHSLDPPAAGGSGERPCIGAAAPPHCPRDAATEAGSGGLTALRQSLSHDGSRYRIAVGGAVTGTRYYFRVRGRNYAAHGEWSDVASLVAVRDGPQPEVQGPTRPRGPSSALMEVSIAAAAAPVTEGGDAVFTLTRSGATAAALTVAVSVTEAGSVLSGTAPTAVTFPAQASEVQLSVATLDDEAAEADARVTAAVVSGAGYRVAAGAGTAGIDVLDNDRTASSVIVLWSADMAVVDYGTGGIGAGSADLFSNVGGSGGLQARWLWYYAPERTLYLAFAQSLPESAELTLHVGDVVLAFPGGDASFSWDDIDVDWTDGQTVAVRLTLEDDEDESTTGPGVSVADAQVREAAGASLVFRVTLEVAQTTAVSVRYATADGTATAGADYRSVSGAVRFEPGETEQTVEVAVLNDAHDEDAETLTLTLSEPFAARLTDAEATGTIENADPLPQAWLARFGRTAAEQVLGAVDRRLRASRSAETQVTLAGHRIPHAPPAADPAAIDAAAERQVAAWLRGEPEASTARHLTARELLSESAFQAGVPTADGGNLTLWGGGAFTRFGGRDGAVELDGDVSAALLGADYASGGWLAGLALAYHESIGGSYRPPAAGGELHSWLVGGYPYVGYAAERLALWGAAGYGQGRLTLTAPGDEPLETGIPAAAGSRRRAWRAAGAGERGRRRAGGERGRAGAADQLGSDARLGGGRGAREPAAAGSGGQLRAEPWRLTADAGGGAGRAPRRRRRGDRLRPGPQRRP